jgi:predicted DNA-binding transcriptional regulator AlpA
MDHPVDDLNRFMRINEIAKFLGVSRETLERLFNAGTIKRRHLSARCAGAMRRDVLAYLESRT